MSVSFQFSSVADFMWMSGHGPYVWAAYLITIVALSALGFRARALKKNFFKVQSSIVRRQNSSGKDQPAAVIDK